MPDIAGGVAYRIHAHDEIVVFPSVVLNTLCGFGGQAHITYDDGEEDLIKIPETPTPSTTTPVSGDHPAKKNGWVDSLEIYRLNSNAFTQGVLYLRVWITTDVAGAGPAVRQIIAQAYLDPGMDIGLGMFQSAYAEGAVLYMNATFTQANVAGGAIIVDVGFEVGGSTLGNLYKFTVLSCRAINGGTNGLQMAKTDTNNNTFAQFVGVASAASTNSELPDSVTTATTSGGMADSTPVDTRTVTGSARFTVAQTVAGAQNDTLQILMEILAVRGAPTVSFSRSTNPANVSVTAGAASFAPYT